ncbi:hypothetical protein [Sphingomonas sp. VNH70]|uniref:hypothetical protein n=1 Tax=Sphingomonas silueang TaxID=3156617 RepID=UPI0032B58EF1
MLPLTLPERRRMDLNALLHDHQVARMRADHAPLPELAAAQRALAACYARRISELRDLLGASGAMVLA